MRILPIIVRQLFLNPHLLMIETPRLIFKKYSNEDLPLLIEQRSDPEVNRYLGGPERQNPEALTDRIKFYMACYEKFGFGMCTMILKETGETIGSAGIQPLEDTGEIEVGYSLIKDQWGRGLGTEAADGWMRFGFISAGLDRIVAVANIENTASTNIMKKLGMTFEKMEMHYGHECAFYAISRDDFLHRNG